MASRSSAAAIRAVSSRCWRAKLELISRPSSLHPAQQLERSQHVHRVLQPERFARALFALHEVHRHFDECAGEPQRLDEDFGLEPVAGRLNAQALEDRRLMNLE